MSDKGLFHGNKMNIHSLRAALIYNAMNSRIKLADIVIDLLCFTRRKKICRGCPAGNGRDDRGFAAGDGLKPA